MEVENGQKFNFQTLSQKGKKYRKAEYVQRRVCFVNVQSSLHETERSEYSNIFEYSNISGRILDIRIRI